MYRLALYRKVYTSALWSPWVDPSLPTSPLDLLCLFESAQGGLGLLHSISKPDRIRELQTDGPLSTNFPVPHLLLCFCKKEAKPQLNVSLSLTLIVFGGIGCGCVLSFYPLALELLSHQRLTYHFLMSLPNLQSSFHESLSTLYVREAFPYINDSQSVSCAHNATSRELARNENSRALPQTTESDCLGGGRGQQVVFWQVAQVLVMSLSCPPESENYHLTSYL